MKKALLIGLATSNLFFTGCSDELKKPEPTVDSRVRELSSGQISVSVKGLDQPNIYQVEFSWPDAQGSVRVTEHEKILAVVPGTNRTFVDTFVAGGSERSYLIEHLSSDGHLSSSIPFPVKIPKDIFWDGKIDFTEHQKIDAERVFLSDKAVITTFDKNFTIVTKEFISEGGVIQNFSDGAESTWEKNGRSGGTISIMAKRGRGTLQVHLRGEGGGHGKNGCITDPNFHPGCAGTTGGNGGNAGSLNVTFEDGRELNISYDNTEGKKGRAGVRGSVPYGTPNAVHPPCDRDTPNGLDGQTGGKGQVCLKMTSEQDYVCL